VSQSQTAREIVRGARTTALATIKPPSLELGGGAPFASLALVACDYDASPILLLSRLARHTQNLMHDSRLSLLFDRTGMLDDPISGPRVTLSGRAVPADRSELWRRFTNRHPSSAEYAGFDDFDFYRVDVDEAHLVAGFGKIERLSRSQFLLDTTQHTALISAESSIVDHMNEDHADAMRLMANKQTGGSGGEESWQMTGIDPEGIDMTSDSRFVRCAFKQPVENAEQARQVLVQMTKDARA